MIGDTGDEADGVGDLSNPPLKKERRRRFTVGAGITSKITGDFCP